MSKVKIDDLSWEVSDTKKDILIDFLNETTIKEKNTALLNIKHENPLIRKYCKDLLIKGSRYKENKGMLIAFIYVGSMPTTKADDYIDCCGISLKKFFDESVYCFGIRNGETRIERI